MPREDQTKEVVLQDDYGNSVRYTIIPHRPDDALEILADVLRIGAPVFEAISGTNLGEVDTDDLQSGSLGGVDLGGISQHVDRLVGEFIRAGGSTFLRKLLRNTVRTDSDGKMTKVDTDAGYTEAYHANLGELFAVTKEVLDANYGPLLRGRLAGALNAA